ncbi:hypothetical protein B9Q00_11400 [Candidatus Marsarchaeota G1 archaeon OSP_C]|jgi:hypothetical protein|uniref:Uncharacterized protein n=1 Tax=Candidatus Marsarchaeota G1 archaeon OSP_C TaxID=1978154 RepID=A0A2R6AEP3_9ARCH|nr:MAG: hypothetical protein B9Q00_11400 [Candidatus Marsarchaeota G1 archaeon OSP_C]
MLAIVYELGLLLKMDNDHFAIAVSQEFEGDLNHLNARGCRVSESLIPTSRSVKFSWLLVE